MSGNHADNYCQEADYLYKWCLADKETLVKAELDRPTLEEDLPVRILAAGEAQSNRRNIRFDREEARK